MSATATAAAVLTPAMEVREALALVASGRVSIEAFSEWDAERIKLIERKAAASAPPRSLSCKVSEKGCLSVYGLNRQWPVSLYVEQWERLFAFREQVEAFAKANSGKLARKAS